MKRGLKEASKFEITAIQDADASEAMLKIYAGLEKQGELNRTRHWRSSHPHDA